MTKALFNLIAVLIYISSCGQNKSFESGKELIINPEIKSEVEKKISISEFGAGQETIQIYNNLLLGDFYENDKKIISATEDDQKKSVFKSFYFWRTDTLQIEGAYGLFGGIGFTIKIVNGKTTLYHMLSADDVPIYAYEQKDSLTYRLEVSCNDTKIILSEIPDIKTKSLIYGYVEFKSKDYYSISGSVNGNEVTPRTRQRANMRIYFKSAYLEL